MKEVNLSDFEVKAKALIDEYVTEYKENNDGNPEDWPITAAQGTFFEDFLCWIEIKGKDLP